MSDEIIKLSSITKTYFSGFGGRGVRRLRALNGISLEIKRGEIFGLLGPNGAGKTTLLNIIIGLLKSDSGNITIMGRDVTQRFPNEIKLKMNMCSGNPNFAWCMSVKETLIFYGMLYGMGISDAKKEAEKWIGIFELGRYANTRFDELSTGTKQRLAMAKSLMNEPEILLLDEPTIGLDPDIGQKIRGFIKKIHAETSITIILTTHYMKEAEELSDRIAFIKNGNIVAQGSIEEIKNATKTRDLEGAFLEIARDENI